MHISANMGHVCMYVEICLKSSGRPSVKIKRFKITRHKPWTTKDRFVKITTDQFFQKLRNALCTLQKKPQIVFVVRRSDTKKQRERTLWGEWCGNKLCSVRTKNNQKWRRQSFGLRVWKATNYLPLLWTEATQRKNDRAPGILRNQDRTLPKVQSIYLG